MQDLGRCRAADGGCGLLDCTNNKKVLRQGRVKETVAKRAPAAAAEKPCHGN